MLGYEVCVPPYVRQGLFSRSINNDDFLPKMRKPVLITHGAAAAVVKPAVVAQHKGAMPPSINGGPFAREGQQRPDDPRERVATRVTG